MMAWSSGGTLDEEAPVKEDATEGDWQGLGASAMWSGRNSSVQVSLAFPDLPAAQFPCHIQHPLSFWEIHNLPGMAEGTGLGIESRKSSGVGCHVA